MHPVSLLIYLMGTPETLFYTRTSNGAGVANFTFPGESVATISMTHGSATNGGMEHTQIFSKNGGQHIVIENNIRLRLHRTPPGIGYGDTPSYYQGTPGQVTAVWEPEFSLGQLYNKGLFLLGYYGEVEAFARAVLNNQRVPKAGLDDAITATKIFEAFAHGSNKVITLSDL
jgi:predicted dehydrogenase